MSHRAVPTRALCAGILAIAILNGTRIAGQPTMQIHPASGPGGNIVIGVLADNFTSAQSTDFMEAAENFFTQGLLVDPFFSAHKPAFTIKTLFEAVPSMPASKYGFTLGASTTTNCSVQWNQNGIDTTAELERAATTLSATHVVVLGNYNYNFGCAHDSWVYLAVGGVGQQVIHHEMGHLIAGLFDEFGLAANDGQSYPTPLDRLNCSTLTNPHWNAISGSGRIAGCDHFDIGIAHPYESCRMGIHGTAFCPVCEKAMIEELACATNPPGAACTNPVADAGTVTRPARSDFAMPHLSTAGLAFLQQPPAPRQPPEGQRPPVPQPAPAESRVLRLLLRVSSKANAPVTVVSANDSTGRVVAKLRRVGDFVYEVSEKGAPVTIGVIPGNPFQTRSYGGGVAQHRANVEETAAILVPIPRESRESIGAANRAIEVAIYRLTAQAGNDPITPARLTELRKREQAVRFATLTAADLKRQLYGAAAK